MSKSLWEIKNLYTGVLVILLILPVYAFAACIVRGSPPFCNGGCETGEVATESTSSGCWTGSQTVCCPVSPGPFTSCHWSGTSPFCNGQCNAGESRIASISGSYQFDSTGPSTTASAPEERGIWAPSVIDSFGQDCITGAKALCCSNVAGAFGPLTAPRQCRKGFVWREAYKGDFACVEPAARDQAAKDNSLAKARLAAKDGKHKPGSCKKGYVWRLANPNDHVCVTPTIRDQTRKDNKLAPSRTAS